MLLPNPINNRHRGCGDSLTPRVQLHRRERLATRSSMSTSSSRRPHAVVVSFPSAGQINPMLELAKLLHLHGFFITFVHTSYSHQKIQSSSERDLLKESDSFRVETIPDGHSSSDPGAQGVIDLLRSIKNTCPAPLEQLLKKLGSSADVPPITSIIGNFLMTFVGDIAAKLGLPFLVFWTTSACSLLASIQLPELIRRGYAPLKDESCLRNGYLDTAIDWMPGMKDIRLKELSSFIRTTDPDDFFLNEDIEDVRCAMKALGLILNTFDRLEGEVLDAIKDFFPRVYTIGPLLMLLNHAKANPMNSARLSLWEEDYSYRQWLDTQENGSVIYVSFGSVTSLTREQTEEFAWGLADSGRPFLWIIRPNLLDSGGGALPEEFINETRGRSCFARWCHQSEVLSHPAVGGFLTHGGWNSMLESMCSGVPMVCWPAGFCDQYTNCRYACVEWGIGVGIEEQVRRESVKDAVEELMGGERGRQASTNVLKWRERAEEASAEGGTSDANLMALKKALDPV